MSKLAHADAIRKLANQYASMVAAADALEQLGSIEQARDEALKAADKAKADVAKAKANLEKVQEQIRVTENQAAGAIEQAREEAKKLVEDARTTAKKGADTIVARAESKSRKIEDEAAARYEAAVEKENEVRNVLAEMQAERAALSDEVDALKAEHARILALIVEVRSKLGG